MRLYDYEASGNCYKVRLLLSHLGTEVERVPTDIFGGATLTEEYAARNPVLTTPVLETDAGEYLAESGAILLFLARESELLPRDPMELAQVHRWLFFEQSSVLPVIARLRFLLVTGRLDPSDQAATRLAAIGGVIATTLDNFLATREFFVADRFTVADIALYGYMHVAEEAAVAVPDFAHLTAWLDRVRSLPGHVADLVPYPENARPGKGQSVYDFISL